MSASLRELMYLHIPMPVWWVLGPFLAWRVGLRLYRLNALQSFSHGRYWGRAASLGLLTAAVGVVAYEENAAFYSLCAGLAAGTVIGIIATRLTKMRIHATGTWIQPDPLIGAVLSVLLIGRIVFRFFAGSTSPMAWTLAAFVRNPSTMILFGLFTAHYFVFALGMVGAASRHRKGPPGAAIDSRE